jgi:RimJ/RimL family protein N-acetyltransferase
VIIASPRLVLRPITPDDAEGPYREWMGDPLVLQHLEARLSSGAPELRDYIRTQEADPDVHFYAILVRQGGRHIGNIKLGPIQRWHRRADVGIIIGDRSQWGRGYATEAIRAFTEAMFEAEGLEKVTAGAYATNVASVRAFEGAGFHVEAVRRRHYRTADGWVDGIHLARFAPGSAGASPDLR